MAHKHRSRPACRSVLGAGVRMGRCHVLSCEPTSEPLLHVPPWQPTQEQCPARGSIGCGCSLAAASAAPRAAAGPGAAQERLLPGPQRSGAQRRPSWPAAPAGTHPRRLRFWQGYTHARSYFEAPARRAMVAAAPRTAGPRAIPSAARPQRAPGSSMPVQPLCMLRRVQGSRCTTVRRHAETMARLPSWPARRGSLLQLIRGPGVT